jgi:hypothetical protein
MNLDTWISYRILKFVAILSNYILDAYDSLIYT